MHWDKRQLHLTGTKPDPPAHDCRQIHRDKIALKWRSSAWQMVCIRRATFVASAATSSMSGSLASTAVTVLCLLLRPGLSF